MDEKDIKIGMWLRWKHGNREEVARVVEITDRGLRVVRADGVQNLGLCTAEHAEPCLPPSPREGWYRCGNNILRLARIDTRRWEATPLNGVSEPWSDEAARRALAAGTITFWAPQVGDWVRGPVVAAMVVSQNENGDEWNVQLLDGRRGCWPAINMEPWVPQVGDWVCNIEAPHLPPFRVVDVHPGFYTSTRHLFAYNYTKHGETTPRPRRSARVDKCMPCLPPATTAMFCESDPHTGRPALAPSMVPISATRVKTDAPAPQPTGFVLGSSSARPDLPPDLHLVPVEGRPGVFYDPKHDRTFYGGALNAVVDGPPKLLVPDAHKSQLFREIDPSTGAPISDSNHIGAPLHWPDAEFFWRPRVGDLVAPRTADAKLVFSDPCNVVGVEVCADGGWTVRLARCQGPVHATHLKLVCRNENAPPTTHMRTDGTETHLVPVHGQPGLYREVSQSPDGKMTVGPVQHELGANDICRVCKGPAYLGLGLEPPKCLSPVCEPAKEPEPKCVEIMHDPHGIPRHAEKIWQAFRTNERGELIEGKHPLKERAVAVFRENWEKRRRA